MYKIYIGDQYLLVINDKEFQNIDSQNVHILSDSIQYSRENLIEMLTNKVHLLTYYQTNLVPFYSSNFFNQFKIIEAAGGLVQNSRNELLFIFRLGKWDLPKGKLDKNESREDAAIREIKEECGVDVAINNPKFFTTYHCYFWKQKIVLKITYWFQMDILDDNQALTPQLDEDISEVKWIPKNEIPLALENTYPAIKDLVTENFGLKKE